MLDTAYVAGLRHAQLVPHFLMAGWLYEQRSVSLMSDEAWDFLCQRLDSEWDNVTHPHKHLVKRCDLHTATASYLTDSIVPSMARNAALQLLSTLG